MSDCPSFTTCLASSLQNILMHLMMHGNHVYQKERVLLKQESEREGVRPWEEALEFALSPEDIGGGS